MTKDEATKAGVDNHRLYFKTFNDKANLQPPADKSDWFRLISIDLGNGPLGGVGDSVGVVTRWEWPDRGSQGSQGSYWTACRGASANIRTAAAERSNSGLMGFVERLGRRTSRRA